MVNPVTTYSQQEFKELSKDIQSLGFSNETIEVEEEFEGDKSKYQIESVIHYV